MLHSKPPDLIDKNSPLTTQRTGAAALIVLFICVTLTLYLALFIKNIIMKLFFDRLVRFYINFFFHLL